VDAKIDYLSFTLMEDLRDQGQGRALQEAVVQTLWAAHPHLATFCEGLRAWQPAGSRGHYGEGLFNPTTYTSIRYGGHANHILVELPGTACQAARDAGLLDHILQAAAGRLTRLDLAVDIPGGCSPAEFVGAGYSDRFKAHASIVSEQGTTEYVGSMKSERYARVYMYAAPHPRAGVLRVEHVLRGDYAKAAADALGSGAALMLAEMCGRSWGWEHASWQPGHSTDGKLHARRSDRHEPGRVRWLHKVVLPALVRASDEGLIDLEEFWSRLAAFKAARAGAQEPPE